MAKFTTMRVGGKPKSLTKCESTAELYEAVLEAWNQESNYQILAGGSNTVYADDISILDEEKIDQLWVAFLIILKLYYQYMLFKEELNNYH
jgi:UDP-N-acetylenolpyruvoylglucosamine reductase